MIISICKLDPAVSLPYILKRDEDRQLFQSKLKKKKVMAPLRIHVCKNYSQNDTGLAVEYYRDLHDPCQPPLQILHATDRQLC